MHIHEYEMFFYLGNDKCLVKTVFKNKIKAVFFFLLRYKYNSNMLV